MLLGTSINVKSNGGDLFGFSPLNFRTLIIF
jgi:hypothetical protein